MDAEVLTEVFRIIESRRDHPSPNSYVAGLLGGGLKAVNEKITEETQELIAASLDEPDGNMVHEAADVLFHVMVLLAARRISIEAVYEELHKRRKPG